MWVYLVVMVAMYFLGKLLAPKVRNAAQQAVTGVITIDNTQCVPVVFGTCEMKQANNVWYGNLFTNPIYSSDLGGQGK